MTEQKVLTPEQIAIVAEQARLKVEHDRSMAVKVALVETSRTRGWPYIKKIAENIIQTSLQHSLNVEDETESERFRIETRVARKVFGQLFGVIDTTLDFGTESEPDWFSELGSDFQIISE
jgi:hypothetical protein